MRDQGTRHFGQFNIHQVRYTASRRSDRALAIWHASAVAKAAHDPVVADVAEVLTAEIQKRKNK